MARGKKAVKELSPEEKLQQALVPAEEQPYPIPENWCWIHLLASFENHTDSKKKVQNNKYLKNGKLAVVDQGQELVGGYTDDENMAYSGELPVIIFGDHTRCIKYIDFPFSQGADGVKVLSPKTFYDARAFFFALQSVEIPNMGYRRHYPLFPQFCIPVPPLAEQHRIVSLIESLFAKLDEAKEKAQAVVDSFELRKSAILHMAFTGELAGISDGITTPLESIVEAIRIGPFGSALHKEDYITGGIPIVNPKHIINQQIMPENNVTITEEKADELTAYRLKTGDIIMGRRGEMGRSAPVTEKENGWLCGTGSLIIKLQDGYSGAFYSQIIASHSSIQYLEENCVGSTMKNLNEKVIKSLPVPDYTKEQQKIIVAILNSLLKKEQQAKESVEAVLDQIDTMKKVILARAFRGELGTNDPAEESAAELLKSTLHA
jgi:type I restriction enzyme S subunit